jgi:hypothetical protein
MILLRGLSETTAQSPQFPQITPQSPQTTPQLDEMDSRIIKIIESKPSAEMVKEGKDPLMDEAP